MKHLQTYLAFTLLLIIAFGCGTTEDTETDVDMQQESLLGKINGEVALIEGLTIHVRLLKDGQTVSQTEADGNFEFADLESGNYTVQITAKGYETIETTKTVSEGEIVQLDKATLVALTIPVAHLTGLLKETETGNPVAGGLVQLMDETGDEFEAITSQDGVYTFENLPVNQSFTLTVMSYGYKGQAIDVNPIPADETAELDVELTAIPETVILDPSEGIQLGTLAPDFELSDSNNNKLKLSDTLKNSNVVIVFYRGDF